MSVGFGHPLYFYGDEQVFRNLLEQGFTEVAFGVGPWVGDARLVGVFAFFKPDSEEVATLETFKFYTDSGSTARANPKENRYTMEEYQAHIEKWQLGMYQPSSLTDVIKMWDDDEVDEEDKTE